MQEEAGTWGHEYVRSLSGEIGQEYNSRREKDEPVEDLLELVAKILPYHMSHNAGRQPLTVSLFTYLNIHGLLIGWLQSRVGNSIDAVVQSRRQWICCWKQRSWSG